MMIKMKSRIVGVVGAMGMLLGSVSFSSAVVAAGANPVEEGKEIAFSRKKGNCLACHMIKDAQSPGNIAPPLLAMKSRYPDKAKLRAQIWDATKINFDSAMPPFGKHGVLSESEIDKVVEYIWTL
jgi:sulfur-oxidizing protein SoxX